MILFHFSSPVNIYHQTVLQSSKSFFFLSPHSILSRFSSAWESTRLKIEPSVVQICEPAFLINNKNSCYSLIWKEKNDALIYKDNLIDKGLLLLDILQLLSSCVMFFDFPDPLLATILENLSEIEANLSFGCSDIQQLYGLVATFVFVRTQ